MIRSIRLSLPFLLFAGLLPLRPQDGRDAQQLLDHALRLADLYNWDDAGKYFAEAEKLFVAKGDDRNALLARLGRIRSTVDQRALHDTSAQLASDLDNIPLLRTDKQLRLFCLIVKGDIDTEIDASAMRDDWERILSLAKELGDMKWQYRALAQLGVAAFYEGDLATAGKNVASALAAATKAGDSGAQVRLLTNLGVGLRESHMYEEALSYFDNALKVASTIPDLGYPFAINEARLETLVELNRTEDAQRLADEILTEARQRHHPLAEAIALTSEANIAAHRNDNANALQILQQAMALSERPRATFSEL